MGSQYVDTANRSGGVSPVWQFICLLAPIVMTGFYVVYGLVGLTLEGNSQFRWCEEALEVGRLVLAIIVAINAVVMLYAGFQRLALRHVLWISPLTHIAIALAVTATIALGSGCE